MQAGTEFNLLDFGRKEKMPTSICPECDEEVFVDAESEQGDKVVCDECGASLVVVGLDPIELDLKDETEEDLVDDDKELYDYDSERY
jgi:lysine biosynthesis protein LysW